MINSKRLKNFSILLCCIFFIFSIQQIAASTVVLSDAELATVLDHLEKSKIIIEENQKKWNNIRTATPEITYDIQDNLIIQSIIIPVENDEPLKFENRFKVTRVAKKESLVPLTIRFIGGIETTNALDVKIGIKFLSAAPVPYKKLRPFGLNLLIGIKSSGLSVSYDLPSPFRNTSIHIYYGIDYSTLGQKVIGLGMGLNF